MYVLLFLSESNTLYFSQIEFLPSSSKTSFETKWKLISELATIFLSAPFLDTVYTRYI